MNQNEFEPKEPSTQLPIETWLSSNATTISVPGNQVARWLSAEKHRESLRKRIAAATACLLVATGIGGYSVSANEFRNVCSMIEQPPSLAMIELTETCRDLGHGQPPEYLAWQVSQSGK